MQNKFSNISVPNIPVAIDFKSQQRSLVVAFGNLVAQLNQPIDNTFDVQNNRITGLLDPAQLNDAVPLSYLQRQLANFSINGNGGGITNLTNTVIGNALWLETNVSTISYTIPSVGSNIIVNILSTSTALSTVTLPNATLTPGQMLVIKHAGGIAAGNMGVQAATGQTLDGDAGVTVPRFGALYCESDGSINWRIINIWNYPNFHRIITGTNITVFPSDNYVIVATASLTVTLPDATQDREWIVIVRNDSGFSGGGVGVQSIAGQTVEGAPGLTVPIFGAVAFFSTGLVDWKILWTENFSDLHVITTGTSFSVPPGDDYMVDATAIITATLPDATQNSKGRLVILKNDSGSSGVTLLPQGAQTIDGSASIVLGTQSSVGVVSVNTTDWKIIFSNSTGTSTGTSSTAVIDMTLTSATTTITAAATTAGQLMIVYLTQDSTGGRQIVWGTNFKAITSDDIVASINAVNIYTFGGRADTKWYALSSNIGN